MIKQITPRKVGKKFYLKMYGIEYELILPKEEDVKTGKKGKTNKKVKLVEKIVK